MKLNTNFTVAVHTLLCIEYFKETYKVTSDFIASSTNVNPVIIRKILGKLHSANLVETKAGVGGSILTKPAEKITLLDIYKAVTEESDNERIIFNFHKDPNSKCPVGSKINSLLENPLANAQKALEDELSKTTLKMLLEKI